MPSPTTFEEVWALPDEYRGELVDGVWVPEMTEPTWRHGQVVLNVAMLLGAYAKQHPEWSAAAGDFGTKLRHKPDTLRSPDAGLLRTDRVPTGDGVQGWVEGAPELVVEVRRKSQSFPELMRKAVEYLRAGAQMVWVVDPARQEVAVFTSDHVRVVARDEQLDAEPLLPGFRCSVAELFE